MNNIVFTGMLDNLGKIVYASPSTEKMFGFSCESYIGMSAFSHCHPADLPMVMSKFASLVASKTPTYVRFRYKHMSEGWRIIEVIGTPVLDAETGKMANIFIKGDFYDQTDTAYMIESICIKFGLHFNGDVKCFLNQLFELGFITNIEKNSVRKFLHSLLFFTYLLRANSIGKFVELFDIFF